MDYTKALERNFDALAAIILALGAMLRAGIIGDGRITKILRLAVLRILTPAESAVRRLIVIAARDLPWPSLWQNWYPGEPGEREKPEGPVTRLAFPLFERQNAAPKSLKTSGPRIRSLSEPGRDPAGFPAAPLAPPPIDPTVDARRLWLRFEALHNALAGLPAEARRLVWHQARRGLSKKLAPRPPLRSGNPPGHRKKRTQEIDDVLKEFQFLAEEALADTS